jgi:hypothetical protein
VSDATNSGYPAFLKGFTGFFRVEVIAVTAGESPSDNLVTLRFLDGGTGYLAAGDLFKATFNPLDDESNEVNG